MDDQFDVTQLHSPPPTIVKLEDAFNIVLNRPPTIDEKQPKLTLQKPPPTKPFWSALLLL
jgi:hypothetical protein